jgi:hypothetical protein
VNKLVILKVLVLVAALCGVIYVISHMTPDKVSQGMQQVGLAPTAAPSTGDSVNLCRTRVRAIIWQDGRKIKEAQDGMKAHWQAFNLTAQDIGSMDVEKWLSLHCEVAVVARDASSDSNPASATKPFVTFEYIDKGRENLDRSANGLYRFAGRTFASPDLDKAFEDLIKLANLQPTGP